MHISVLKGYVGKERIWHNGWMIQPLIPFHCEGTGLMGHCYDRKEEKKDHDTHPIHLVKIMGKMGYFPSKEGGYSYAEVHAPLV